MESIGVSRAAPRVTKLDAIDGRLPSPDARVDDAIEDVRAQLTRKNERGRDYDDAHEQGRVAAQAGRHHCLAQTGIREHLLHEHRTAKDFGDRCELEGDGGK